MCSGGMELRWPDGGALLDQPVKLVEAFGTVGAAIRTYEKKGG